jgi:hypothetical protein
VPPILRGGAQERGRGGAGGGCAGAGAGAGGLSHQSSLLVIDKSYLDRAVGCVRDRANILLPAVGLGTAGDLGLVVGGVTGFLFRSQGRQKIAAIARPCGGQALPCLLIAGAHPKS